jgi:hypothetical protein
MREISDYCGGKERLARCFDPQNFVHRHFAPWQAWQALKLILDELEVELE